MFCKYFIGCSDFCTMICKYYILLRTSAPLLIFLNGGVYVNYFQFGQHFQRPVTNPPISMISKLPHLTTTTSKDSVGDIAFPQD